MSTAPGPLSGTEPDPPEIVEETTDLVDAAGVLLVFAIIGERLGAVQLAGGAVVLAGVLVLHAR